jgi:hypothetical protein
MRGIDLEELKTVELEDLLYNVSEELLERDALNTLKHYRGWLTHTLWKVEEDARLKRKNPSPE